MKRFIFAGVVILIAMFAVTCDEGLSDDNAIVDYTDNVVSQDGSSVTVYFDGETVPVTKAQRAMTRDLAMMSYDFLEVIFVNTAGISRYSWELGQPAGISGSGLRISGSNYGHLTGTTTTTLQHACIFVGSSSNKTLFGVGRITNTTSKTTNITTAGAAITDDTKSVTFSIAAIQTGLLVGKEAVSSDADLGYPKHGIPVDSFVITSDASAGDGYTVGYTTRDGYSARQALPDGISYPTYSLPKTAKTITNATYTFKFMTNLTSATTPTDSTTVVPTGLTGNYLNAIKHVGPTLPPLVQKRIPRYMDGGRYLEAKGHVDTKTKVAFRTTYLYTSDTDNLPSAGADFVNVVPLQFKTENGSGGIFSFYLQIPVYMLNNGAATLNAGPAAEIWYIRTGLGSELYSLDDGSASGGCVFMSSGVSASDWLEIITTWIP